MGGLIYTGQYTLVQGFCFFWLFLMGCKELKHARHNLFVRMLMSHDVIMVNGHTMQVPARCSTVENSNIIIQHSEQANTSLIMCT